MADWVALIDELRRASVDFADGLTDAEVTSVESHFGLRFPPDLRAFLQTALPVGEGFPDWRSGPESALRDRLDAPLQGLLFDVGNGFWRIEWGPQPRSRGAERQRVREMVAAAPKLIPVYAHRMIPAEPAAPGNPVLSVRQSDIIYYGYDLEDYFRHEFGLPGRKPWPRQIRRIRFWELFL